MCVCGVPMREYVRVWSVRESARVQMVARHRHFCTNVMCKHRGLLNAHADLDTVIALTHQDMAEDLLLAESGMFSVLLAGHDHEPMQEVRPP